MEFEHPEIPTGMTRKSDETSGFDRKAGDEQVNAESRGIPKVCRFLCNSRERAALARVLDCDRSKFTLSLPRPGELRDGWFNGRSCVAGVSSSIASSYTLLHRLTVANIYLAAANKTNMPHFDSYHPPLRTRAFPDALHSWTITS